MIVIEVGSSKLNVIVLYAGSSRHDCFIGGKFNT